MQACTGLPLALAFLVVAAAPADSLAEDKESSCCARLEGLSQCGAGKIIFRASQGSQEYRALRGPTACLGLKEIQALKGHQARRAPLGQWGRLDPKETKEMQVPPALSSKVFQRRQDGSVDFFRDWKSYKKGFGNQASEFWLGNDNIHLLTSSGTYQLRIDARDFNESSTFAKYTSFKLLSEKENYTLALGSYSDGTMGDSLSGHAKLAFSTRDKDHDTNEGSCAILYKGGWWYGGCHSSNLNGLYLKGEHSSYADGINWSTGKGYRYSYKYVDMKIRPQ